MVVRVKFVPVFWDADDCFSLNPTVLWSWTCFGGFRTEAASNKPSWIVFFLFASRWLSLKCLQWQSTVHPLKEGTEALCWLAPRCVLGCLHLTVVHQCAGTSMWPTSWFLSGFCYLAMSGEEITPALGACLSDDPIRDIHCSTCPDREVDARRAVPAWSSWFFPCQNESWMWENR